MEKIIKKLYNMDLNQNLLRSLQADRKNAIQEWECYNDLFEKIPKESTKSFLRYMNLRANRECEELEKAYACGFKTAIRLLLESLKD